MAAPSVDPDRDEAAALAGPGRPFLPAVRAGLVGDAAMGTALLARGVSADACLEMLSLSRPELVRSIHEAHVRAGALAIETHSFGANRFRLARHGLEARVAELNRAAASIARAAMGHGGFVLGAIGPTGLDFTRAGDPAIDGDRVRDAFREQAGALAEAGVDALLVETMQHPVEIELAVTAARAAAPRLPLVVLVAVDDRLTLADGSSLVARGARLRDLGVDVIGVNCTHGPALFAAIEALGASGLPLAAYPSAGVPAEVDGRWVYPTPPEAFGATAQRLRALGVGLVGGCCGTTEAHVECIAASFRADGGDARGAA